MNERNNEYTEKIWAYLHGEMDESEVKEILALARHDDKLARLIEERKRLNTFLHSSLQILPRSVEELARDMQVEVEPAPSRQRPLLLFPSWTRAAQLAAACLVALLVLQVAIPRGPVHWGATQVVLLETTRSVDEVASVKRFNGRDVKQACAALQKAITDEYGGRSGPENVRWDLRMSVIEFAGGKFEVSILGSIPQDDPRTFDERNGVIACGSRCPG